MGGSTMPGPLGLDDAPASGQRTGGSASSTGAGGPIGLEPATALAGVRLVAKVTKDWDPPSPDKTPIDVSGTTLADVVTALNARPEAGRGGGKLRVDGVPAGTDASVTISLHANLVLQMPNWTDYATASEAAKKEWDRVMVKLGEHEKRHMEIAVEAADALATSLIGHQIGSKPTLVDKVDAANTAMQAEQDKMDAATDHGKKVGTKYGDVNIDTKIT